jgi:hypothetical protein
LIAVLTSNALRPWPFLSMPEPDFLTYYQPPGQLCGRANPTSEVGGHPNLTLFSWSGYSGEQVCRFALMVGPGAPAEASTDGPRR